MLPVVCLIGWLIRRNVATLAKRLRKRDSIPETRMTRSGEGAKPEDDLELSALQALLELLERVGHRRQRSLTLREFFARVHALDSTLLHERLADLWYGVRYGHANQNPAAVFAESKVRIEALMRERSDEAASQPAADRSSRE